MTLPSLGFGGSFSAYTPPTDWGAVFDKSANILKMGLDIRNSIVNPAAQPTPAPTSAIGSGDGGDKVVPPDSGISTPVLLVGGGVAVLAIVLLMKGK